MDVKTTIPITEARRTLFDVAEAVQQPGVYYTLTDKGRPKVVLMSADDYESWQETLEVMRDFPDLKKDIKQTELDLASGRYQKYRAIGEVMGDAPAAVKHPRGYVVRRSSKTKRRART